MKNNWQNLYKDSKFENDYFNTIKNLYGKELRKQNLMIPLSYKFNYSKTTDLIVIVSINEGWEHVSVSCVFAGTFNDMNRCPKWEEMCFVKDLFWNEDELVVQYHPPKKDYVNIHPHVLHLWKPINKEIIAPDPSMV